MLSRIGQRKGKLDPFVQRGALRRKAEGRAVVRQTIITSLAFVVLVAALTREPKRNALVSVDLSEAVSRQEVRAEIPFDSVDLEATEAERARASSSVPGLYYIDQERVSTQLNSLRSRIAWITGQRDTVRQAVLGALKNARPEDDPDVLVEKTILQTVTDLRTQNQDAELPEPAVLALWLMPDAQSLPAVVFTPAQGDAADPATPVVAFDPPEPRPLTFSTGDGLARLALEGLEFVLMEGIRPRGAAPGAAAQQVAILRNNRLPDVQVGATQAFADVPDIETAAVMLRERLRTTTPAVARELGVPDAWAKLHEAAVAMAEPGVSDTLRYDMVSTASARERAREAVPPVARPIHAGQIIQDDGKLWTEQSREDVKIYVSKLENEENPLKRLVGALVAHVILAGLVLVGLSRSVSLLKGETSGMALQYFNLALLILCVTLIVGRVISYFEPTGFIVPMATGSILFAILANMRLASLFGIFLAVLLSAQYGYDWRVLVAGIGMSLAGTFSIFHVRRRSEMAAASIKATVVGLVIMVAISLTMDSMLSEAAWRRMLLIAFNGGICLLAVPALLSPLERLFSITTDIQLLEYSDLNNPLLRQLAIEAPGTYAHSQTLGQLAEAAADAIGANGLMARVCAYYHDIGKMRRSEYFTENQTGYNVHDDLSPRLSARAIAAHVVQGAEMAREFHLPKPIIDGILEHHGTCLIGFFYEQAKKQNKHGDLSEQDFRYPGPKPQRPETAILMICDAAESGVRSIKNPNEERVREFVDSIVASRSADRQFDDCDLTLKQLNVIAEVVTQRVLTNLHTRIAYPDLKQEKKVANVIPMPSGGEP
ncbi:MAG: HDIG domain-containing protein [Candidatus Hydrogenedentes bacterium]|nr:HDIG domain-containing protein [Candidatus Hydrogenedentota bacterium]